METLEGLAEIGPQALFFRGRNGRGGGAERVKRDPHTVRAQREVNDLGMECSSRVWWSRLSITCWLRAVVSSWGGGGTRCRC